MFQKMLEKRCLKVGHKNKTRYLIIRKPETYPFVAADYEASQEYCARCGKTEKIVEVEFIEGYTSVSMPQSYFREMRENGFVVMREC